MPRSRTRLEEAQALAVVGWAITHSGLTWLGATVFNVVTYGTDCAACIGWRIAALTAAAAVIGVVIGAWW